MHKVMLIASLRRVPVPVLPHHDSMAVAPEETHEGISQGSITTNVRRTFRFLRFLTLHSSNENVRSKRYQNENVRFFWIISRRRNPRKKHPLLTTKSCCVRDISRI